MSKSRADEKVEERNPKLDNASYYTSRVILGEGGVDSARESGKDSGRSNLIAAAYPVVGRPFNLLENGRGLL